MKPVSFPAAAPIRRFGETVKGTAGVLPSMNLDGSKPVCKTRRSATLKSAPRGNYKER